MFYANEFSIIFRMIVEHYCACKHTHTHTRFLLLELGHSLAEPQRAANAGEKLPVEQLLCTLRCFSLVKKILPRTPSVRRLRSPSTEGSAAPIRFPQIISPGPRGRAADSRQTRCACLTTESEVYECKHSILPVHALLYGVPLIRIVGWGPFFF